MLCGLRAQDVLHGWRNEENWDFAQCASCASLCDISSACRHTEKLAELRTTYEDAVIGVKIAKEVVAIHSKEHNDEKR